MGIAKIAECVAFALAVVDLTRDHKPLFIALNRLVQSTKANISIAKAAKAVAFALAVVDLTRNYKLLFMALNRLIHLTEVAVGSADRTQKPTEKIPAHLTVYDRSSQERLQYSQPLSHPASVLQPVRKWTKQGIRPIVFTGLKKMMPCFTHMFYGTTLSLAHLLEKRPDTLMGELSHHIVRTKCPLHESHRGRMDHIVSLHPTPRIGAQQLLNLLHQRGGTQILPSPERNIFIGFRFTQMRDETIFPRHPQQGHAEQHPAGGLIQHMLPDRGQQKITPELLLDLGQCGFHEFGPLPFPCTTV